MKEADLKEITAAIGGKLIKGNEESVITGVSTDSRSVQPGDLFFCLMGENSDGHKYAAAAIEKGATAVVVSRDVSIGGAVLMVPDTLIALGDLARWHRRRFSINVVGITGSVGKTTTKEMVGAVLSRQFNVLKNAGNFNNEIGTPLTIFRLTPEHEVLVQEMGMRLSGEIARLAEIAGPNIGIITNIGISHIERLGSKDAIAAAKAELLEALPENGIAILNADDPYFDFLSSKAKCEIVSYGTNAGNVQAQNISVDSEGRPSFDVVIGDLKFDVSLPVVGRHNVSNALAAVAVGIALGVSVHDIVDALANLPHMDKRAHVFDSSAGYRVFDDTYNASPASMESAIRTLVAMKGNRKIAVLGDMRELGDHAARSHRKVGRIAAECKITELAVVGELGHEIAEGAREAGFAGRIVEFESSFEAANALKETVSPGDVVLVKGSRAMEMEKVVEALK